ncbi:CinA family nicotinamide mononucleotide deamidase-related protein [Actinomadura flavalba]|uniref:CinA family nicotinamide mononucleotide deamidase-related protein n=1 Tax=Actinomadura flavalba TaxID=1120938 RepID=UPI00036A3001|nr:CinA family nicotinamide mononucleotide deamidase-related protein [Actinomadura flavalba]
MRVELVTVGDELLLGDVVNGNAAWMGRRLADVGAELTRSVVVPDDLDAIVAALTAALGRADVVVTTGGLGPTYDDLTRDALAKAAGVELVRDPQIEKRLRARGERFRPMTLRMADVPAGATTLENSAGTAPGLRVELRGGVVFALPGVPPEMRSIMEDGVLPEIIERAGLPVAARRTLRTAGVWESVLADRLAPVEAMPRVRLAYLPAPGEVLVRITTAGDDPGPALDAAEERVRELLGDTVYGMGDEPLVAVISGLLEERGATIAAAESLTGGLIAAELTGRAGSSATFAGGIVTYATETKHRLLGVPRELLDAHGAVHPDVAAAMATGVRDRIGSAYGVAVTGVAGPDPQDGQPVGTVFVAVAGPGDSLTVVRPPLPVTGSGPEVRAIIRRMTVVCALDLVRRTLLGLGPGPLTGADGQDREEKG